MPDLPQPPTGSRLSRAGYFALGMVMLGLGFIGALLPLMPTTIFLIAAAWCFARSSPRMENWLMSHAQFGPILLAWQRERAIPRRAKILACAGMTIGFLVFWWSAEPALWLAVLVAAIILGGAAYVVSRPEPSQER